MAHTAPVDVFGHSSVSEKRTRKDRVRSLSNPRNLQKLRECIAWSYKQLRPFRKNHTDAIKQAMGTRYGDRDDMVLKNPYNITRIAIEVWLRQLVSKTPQTHVLSRTPTLKIEAFELQLAMDYLTMQISLGKSLALCTRSALFSMGTMKVGLTSPYLHESAGFLADAGHPYAEPILFEDWCHDMNARRSEEWDWCGNIYSVPYDAVMDNPEYNQKVKDKLQTDEDDSEIDGWPSEERVVDRAFSKMTDAPRYIPRVKLWDLWIPYDNRFVTLPLQAGCGPLLEREWEGPEKGPFKHLGFFEIPGSVMPNAPAQHLYDMQEFLMHLTAEITEQSLRQKTITLIDGRAEADGSAENVIDSRGGEMVRVTDPTAFTTINFPGVNAETFQMLLFAQKAISYLAGNTDLLGGLAPQSESVGQERLLAGSSSEMLSHMQQQVMEFSADVLKDLGYYLYTDPISEFELMKDIPGYKAIPFTYGPESRKGSFFSFSFDITPYSQQYRSPKERLAQLLQLVQGVFMPLSPQLLENGMRIKYDKLADSILRDAGFPELYDIIEKVPVPMGPGGGGPQSVIEKRRPLQSPVTQRNYNVESRSTTPTKKEQEAGLVGTPGGGVKAQTSGAMPGSKE